MHDFPLDTFSGAEYKSVALATVLAVEWCPCCGQRNNRQQGTSQWRRGSSPCWKGSNLILRQNGFFPLVLSHMHIHIDTLVNPAGNLIQNLVAVVVRSPSNCQLETFMGRFHSSVFVSASPSAIRGRIILALSNHIFPQSSLCKSKQEQIFLSSVVK